MTIIVLWGLPGSGKTTYRNRHFPKLPFVDMCDYKSGDWFVDIRTAFEKLLVYSNDVVMEGLFAPNSQSRQALERMAKNAGVDLRYIKIKSTPEECARRLLHAYEAGGISKTEYQNRSGLLTRAVSRYKRIIDWSA